MVVTYLAASQNPNKDRKNLNTFIHSYSGGQVERRDISDRSGSSATFKIQFSASSSSSSPLFPSLVLAGIFIFISSFSFFIPEPLEERIRIEERISVLKSASSSSPHFRSSFQ
ncbi:hypothetical protein NE237_005725 [Protea cynaroides]|uniref:Uncharacterized protein n=1 Tax=Protea cynaroides TaxID=273540 RepID=A0A9Q0KL73_9MAGN|nr:hypothetical protein NE237_005725 [Protea cynaroides]